jgi:hypothetical protein
MAYIEVDIDLDEFDTGDLLSELLSRIGKSSKKKGLSKEELESIKEVVSEYADELGITGPIKSNVEEVLKRELLEKAFEKYSLIDLQTLIPL